MRRLSLSIIVATCCAVLVSSTAMADQFPDRGFNPNPVLFQKDARPYGVDIATWAERASQWFYGQPLESSPLFDPTGANCAVDQQGPVWYVARIAGPPVFSGTRACTIPHQKSIFIYIGAVVDPYPCPAFPSFQPAPGQSLYDFLRADAAPIMDTVDLLEVSLDGQPLSDILGYRYALSNTWQPTEAERRLADPQVLAAMNDLRKIPRETLPERVAKAMNQPAPPKPSAIALQNLRRVWDAGIPVVMGTDAGNIGTLHGPSVFREMEIMTQAGLTPLQVLRSATSNGAKAMGMEREIGTLAPGKLADLLILDADPLANVMNLSKVHRVIKDGKVFVPAELIRSIAGG